MQNFHMASIKDCHVLYAALPRGLYAGFPRGLCEGLPRGPYEGLPRGFYVQDCYVASVQDFHVSSMQDCHVASVEDCHVAFMQNCPGTYVYANIPPSPLFLHENLALCLGKIPPVIRRIGKEGATVAPLWKQGDVSFPQYHKLNQLLVHPCQRPF
jgi:hypothetical protein